MVRARLAFARCSAHVCGGAGVKSKRGVYEYADIKGTKKTA